jgi:hypothetical protein
MNYIAAAALRVGHVIITLPPPARHSHLIRACAHVGYEEFDRNAYEQGFVTNDGTFVTRAEAMQIARAQGQLIPRRGGYLEGAISDSAELYSEDLW